LLPLCRDYVFEVVVVLETHCCACAQCNAVCCSAGSACRAGGAAGVTPRHRGACAVDVVFVVVLYRCCSFVAV
jgi:hypothetical protein